MITTIEVRMPNSDLSNWFFLIFINWSDFELPGFEVVLPIFRLCIKTLVSIVSLLVTLETSTISFSRSRWVFTAAILQKISDSSVSDSTGVSSLGAAGTTSIALCLFLLAKALWPLASIPQINQWTSQNDKIINWHRTFQNMSWISKLHLLTTNMISSRCIM